MREWRRERRSEGVGEGVGEGVSWEAKRSKEEEGCECFARKKEAPWL